MTYKRPRGKCPYCARRYALRKDGTLRFHKTRRGMTCGGSHGRPA